MPPSPPHPPSMPGPPNGPATSPPSFREPRPEPLTRKLGLAGVWFLVINGMIGAGIFGTPAAAQRLAGDFSPWVFVLCGLLITPIMLCFVQLSASVAGTGGPVLYTRTAFGPFAGFQIGWAFYIARLTAFAANLNLLVTSLAFFWPQTQGPITRFGLMLACCAAMAWLNITGARGAVRTLGVITLLKLLPLVVVAIIGLTRVDAAAFTAIADPPGRTDLTAAVLIVIYAYVGFESGLVPAGESRNPQRDMPRALILALLVCTGLYVLIQLAAQRLVPELASSQRPLVDAGAALLGRTGAAIVVAAIVLSIGGNLLGSMFSTSRISYRLALDAQLPSVFARLHPRHETPWFSVLFYALAALALAASGSFVYLAVLSVFTRLLIYLTCIAAMHRVRAATPDKDDRPRLPGGPAIPLLAVGVCTILLLSVRIDSVLATAAMLAVGSILYLIAARSPRKPPAKPETAPDPGNHRPPQPE